MMEKNKDKKEGGPKLLVEATINPQGNYLFITSLDEYQAPRPATLTKITEADLDGAKVPAVELSENGTAVTLMLPGKLVGKRWVPDAALLSATKRLKPGAAVVFKTRDADQKTYLRAIGPAPKEAAKKEPAASDMKK